MDFIPVGSVLIFSSAIAAGADQLAPLLQEMNPRP